MLEQPGLSWGARSEVGNVRRVNEDRCVALPPVFAVADGMGGHERGDVASSLVSEEFAALARRSDFTVDDVAEVVRRANRIVREAGASSQSGRSMGTTLVAAILVGHGADVSWLIVNVGDSRAYRISPNAIRQVTVDHSVVQELVDLGQITAAEARVHPDRNVITRALGVDDGVVPDFVVFTPEAGERLLLCSDGVHGELSDDEIHAVVAGAPDSAAAADALVARVLSGPARDNATVVIVGLETAILGTRAMDDTGPVQALIAEVPRLVSSGSADPSDTGPALRLIVDVPLAPVDRGGGDPERNGVGVGVEEPEVIEVPQW